MQVFRLVREKFALPLTGKGAALKGGRWNSAGVEMIYCAENRSLAMAEVSVHFTLATLPDDYMMMTIHIPDNLQVKSLNERDLPKDWKSFPHPNSTQKVGDEFVFENKYCLMKIPSVITQGEFNILINPNHNDFRHIGVVELVPFPFDSRILK